MAENTTHKEKGRKGGGKKRDKSIENSFKFTGVAAGLAKRDIKLISVDWKGSCMCALECVRACACQVWLKCVSRHL